MKVRNYGVLKVQRNEIQKRDGKLLSQEGRKKEENDREQEKTLKDDSKEISLSYRNEARFSFDWSFKYFNPTVIYSFGILFQTIVLDPELISRIKINPCRAWD